MLQYKRQRTRNAQHSCEADKKAAGWICYLNVWRVTDVATRLQVLPRRDLLLVLRAGVLTAGLALIYHDHRACAKLIHSERDKIEFGLRQTATTRLSASKTPQQVHQAKA